MRLSIITVNLNNKDGLQKTIDSVISQTFKDFEWIVIDGGSIDGSKELIEKYSDYISYWVSEPDKGVYNAMNKGIRLAKGEYLSFMNSGDVFLETKTLLYVFNNSLQGDVIYGDWIKIKNGKEFFRKSPDNISLDFFYNNNICHQAMFIKSNILKADGYDESFRIYADWAKWVSLCLNNALFQYIPITICRFDATDGLSNRKSDKLKEEFERIHDMFPDSFRKILDLNYYYNKELSKYKQSFLIQDTLELINTRPLYCKLIHLNIIIVKYIRRILDKLGV